MTQNRMNVHTDEGIYVLLLDEAQQFDDESIHKLISDLNVAGTVWHGWTPYDSTETDRESIIVFGVDAAIKSVKLYTVDTVELANPDVVYKAPTDTPISDVLNLTYFGNKCRVEVYNYFPNNTNLMFVVPYRINGMPAHQALSEANTIAMIANYYDELDVPLDSLVVLIPPQEVTGVGAARYTEIAVQAYLNPDEDKSAKHWAGWKNDEV